MPRSRAAVHHEVRLRAAGWARRLVQQHGDEAEIVVAATLRRGDLTAQEKLAATFTRDALRDLRRVQGRRLRASSFGARMVWWMTLGPLRRARPTGRHLPHS